MLLTPDRQLAAEVRALEAEEAPGDVDTLLFQLANCKEWVAGAGRREFLPEDREGEARLGAALGAMRRGRHAWQGGQGAGRQAVLLCCFQSGARPV